MAKLFAVCECGKRNEYHQDDIEGLEALIADERSEARADAERDDDDLVDVADILSRFGERPLRALAVAIRRGDLGEAKTVLDALARALGVDAEEQVQQGWFSPEAKPAA